MESAAEHRPVSTQCVEQRLASNRELNNEQLKRAELSKSRGAELFVRRRRPRVIAGNAAAVRRE